MARTNRSDGDDSGPPPPSMDASALDNLDLDDMFADDNDLFSDELDIDLDGIGGMADGLGGGRAAPAAPPRPPPSFPSSPSSGGGPKRKGPKTKRPDPPPPPPPMATTTSSSSSKSKKKQSAAAAAAAAAMESSRRKTKRKTKVPSFWDDGDYEDEPVSAPKTKKQRRGGAKDATSSNKNPLAAPVVPLLVPIASTTTTTTTTTLKGSKSKRGATVAAAVTTTTTSTTTIKGKKKRGSTGAAVADDSSTTSIKSAPTPTSKKSKSTKGSSPATQDSSMPPPISRQGSVAAAGQFGGRSKRGLALGLPMHKGGIGGRESSVSSGTTTTTTTTKTKRKSSSTPTSAGDTSTLPSNKVRRTDSTSAFIQPAVGASGSAEGGSGSLPFSSSHQQQAPTTTGPPKPEPTFCGLKPSRVQFYPFMAALPSEPGMKNRKAYPIMDRISTALAQQVHTGGPIGSEGSGTPTSGSGGGGGGGGNNNFNPSASASPASTGAASTIPNAKQKSNGPPTSGSGGAGGFGGADMASAVPETEAIYKLILETYELSDKDKAAFGLEKRMALGLALGNVRKIMASLEKPRIVGDLYRMCGLLRRQYGFLKQNLQNMHHWCHDNFSEADYQATYGPQEAANAAAAAAATAAADGTKPWGGITSIPGPPGSLVPGSVLSRNSIFKGLTSPLLKLKIKGVPPIKDAAKQTLYVLLPQYVMRPIPPLSSQIAANSLLGSAASSINQTNKSKSKKKKDSLIPMAKSSAGMAAGAGAMAGLGANPSAAAMMALQHQQLTSSSSLPTSLSQQLAAAAAARAAVRKPTPYSDCRPEIRRQRLMDQVMAWATHLETKHSYMMELRSRQIGKRAHEVRKLVHIDTDHDDPELIPALHTQLMWKVLEAAGYLSPPATTFGMPSSPSTTGAVNSAIVHAAPPGTIGGAVGLLNVSGSGDSLAGVGGPGSSGNTSKLPGGASVSASSSLSLSSSPAILGRKWNVNTSLFDDWLKVAWCPEINPRGLLQPKTPQRIKSVIMESNLKEKLRRQFKPESDNDERVKVNVKESLNNKKEGPTSSPLEKTVPIKISIDSVKPPSTDVVIEEEKDDDDDPTAPPSSLSDSLFNRLQSLLVEEDDSDLDDEEDEDDSYEDSDDEDDSDNSMEKEEEEKGVDIEMERVGVNDAVEMDKMTDKDDEESQVEIDEVEMDEMKIKDNDAPLGQTATVEMVNMADKDDAEPLGENDAVKMDMTKAIVDDEDSPELLQERKDDHEDDLKRFLEIAIAVLPGHDYNSEKLRRTRERNIPQTVDLSNLTLEERTFLHLRFAGLVPQSMFPREVELNCVFVPESKADKQNTAISDTHDVDIATVKDGAIQIDTNSNSNAKDMEIKTHKDNQGTAKGTERVGPGEGDKEGDGDGNTRMPEIVPSDRIPTPLPSPAGSSAPAGRQEAHSATAMEIDSTFTSKLTPQSTPLLEVVQEDDKKDVVMIDEMNSDSVKEATTERVTSTLSLTTCAPALEVVQDDDKNTVAMFDDVNSDSVKEAVTDLGTSTPPLATSTPALEVAPGDDKNNVAMVDDIYSDWVKEAATELRTSSPQLATSTPALEVVPDDDNKTAVMVDDMNSDTVQETTTELLTSTSPSATSTPAVEIMQGDDKKNVLVVDDIKSDSVKEAATEILRSAPPLTTSTPAVEGLPDDEKINVAMVDDMTSDSVKEATTELGTSVPPLTPSTQALESMQGDDNNNVVMADDMTSDTVQATTTELVTSTSPLTTCTPAVEGSEEDDKKSVAMASYIKSDSLQETTAELVTSTPPVTTNSDQNAVSRNVEMDEEEGMMDDPAINKDDYSLYNEEYTVEHQLEDEMSYLINSMGADLARLSKTNNARVAFLQSSGHALAVQGHYSKLQQDEQASLISRCQAVLKKSKESKVKSARIRQQQQNQQQQQQQGHNRKQGPSSSSAPSSSSSNNKSKEEYNLPW
jgi:hypothetical protein